MQRSIRNTLLIMVAVAALMFTSSARAELFLRVLVDGIDVVPGDIQAGGPFDTNPADLTSITTDTLTLNAFVAAVNPFVEFVSLGASSNSLLGTPGSLDLATLFQSGLVRYTGATGTATIEILASDNNYSFPLPATLIEETGSATFGRVNLAQGNQATYQSFLDPGNMVFEETIPTSLITLTPDAATDSESFDTVSTSVVPPVFSEYSLTNRVVITLGPRLSGTQFAEIGWNLTTEVIPEPSSMALALLGLPALVVLRRRMRQRQVA